MDAFNLKASELNGGAYLLSGDDAYLIKLAENVFRSLLPDGSLSLYVIDKLYGIDEIASCIGVYGFDGPSVVIVRDADAKPDEAEHRVLVDLLSKGVEPGYLVFENASFLNAAEKKYLTVISCARPDRRVCISYLEKLFPYGIDGDAAGTLADYTDNDLSKINNESKKLLAFCENRRVTQNDVEALVSEDREIQVFAFANAVANGHNALAMKHLERLKIYGTSPAAILATLTGQFQRMLYCTLSPLPDEELAAIMKIKPYAVKKARESGKAGAKLLKGMLEMLLECEYRFKSGEIGDEAALNIAVGKLLRKESI